MTAPKLTYTTKAGNKVTLTSPEQLIIEQGIPCINGGTIKHEGESVKLLVRYDTRPDLAAKVEQWKEDYGKYQTSKAAKFDKNVPGFEALKKAENAAINEEMRYKHEFDRMMETGHSISPKQIDKSLRKTANALSQEYPRAAMYLYADGFLMASNYLKTGAGREAMELIASGGSLEDAENILDNWTPESAAYN